MDAAATSPLTEKLELLFERPGLPRFDLPAPLVAAYGGGLGFERPRLFANFVSSVDGVVALPDAKESGQIVSGSNAGDRFVMGLLRACADTVVVGAGTYRKASRARFDAPSIFPDGTAHFREARARLGLPESLKFVLVTASGEIPPGPALEGDALVFTTRAGKTALASRLPATTRIVTFPFDVIPLAEVLAALRSEGSEIVLTEGGPSLFAELVRGRLVDELFLTTSPSLFGRFPGDRRKSLADGLDLRKTPVELLSARRRGSYLFLRYAIGSTTASDAGSSGAVSPGAE